MPLFKCFRLPCRLTLQWILSDSNGDNIQNANNIDDEERKKTKNKYKEK